MVQETVTLEGHLIDSDILRKAFDRIVEGGGEFEVLEFRVGTHQRRAVVRAADGAARRIRHARPHPGGAHAIWAPPREVGDARFAPAEADGILPDEFYSTTNFDTFVRVDGKWQAARDQKMDCAIVLRDGAPRCVKQGRVQAGRAGRAARARHPRAAAGAQPRLLGVRLHVERRLGRGQQGHRDRRHRARDAQRARRASGSWWWPGPAIVHSGGDAALARLVRGGWVDVLLTGNAFAVHDIEKAILKT